MGRLNTKDIYLKTKNQDTITSSHSFWDIIRLGYSEAGRGLGGPLPSGDRQLPTEEAGRQAAGQLFQGSWKGKAQERDGEQRGSPVSPPKPIPSPHAPQRNRKQNGHSHSQLQCMPSQHPRFTWALKCYDCLEETQPVSEQTR